VDLEDRPVANAIPIATRQPNAFDQPLARGAATGPDGTSTVAIPGGEWVCVRAWDPELKKFANNYVDVYGSAEHVAGVIRLTLVPGAELRATLFMPDGSRAANTRVDILMHHPTRGPWWPSFTETDAEGVAEFPALPAGVYRVEWSAASGGRIDMPEVTLMPGSHVDLGVVPLQ
jgi:hypothetical protein